MRTHGKALLQERARPGVVISVFLTGSSQHRLSLVNQKLTEVDEHTSGCESKCMMPVVGRLLFAINCQRSAHSIIYFQVGFVTNSAANQVIHEWRIIQGGLVVILQQGQREIGELLKVG